MPQIVFNLAVFLLLFLVFFRNKNLRYVGYMREQNAIPSVRTSCISTWVSMGSNPSSVIPDAAPVAPEAGNPGRPGVTGESSKYWRYRACTAKNVESFFRSDFCKERTFIVVLVRS